MTINEQTSPFNNGEHSAGTKPSKPSEYPAVMNEQLDEILRIVRDAGADDDNDGAENWEWSDGKILEAKQSLLQLIKEEKIKELESISNECRTYGIKKMYSCDTFDMKVVTLSTINNRIKELGDSNE